MDTMQKIQIQEPLHIITARSEVRNLARELGFDTMSQARISMAASTLAYLLELGACCSGIIGFGPTSDGNDGIRIEYIVYCRSEMCRPTTRVEDFTKVRQMVDDLTIEKLPSNDIKIVLVKLKI